MRLQDTVSLVTGGTKGIGKAIADRLLLEGSKVVVCSRSIKEVEFVTPSLLYVPADVARVQDVDFLVDTLLSSFGRVDIVVNNAGITRDTLLMRMSDEDWNQVLEVNLSGTFHVCRKVIRPMLKAKTGRIINISSVIGVMGNAGQTNYAASKAGLIGFSKALAKEVANRGILVNVIAPGFMETDMTKDLSAEKKQGYLAQIPLGYPGTGEDVAEAVVFLASKENRYITGQVLHVDGGLVI